MILLHYVCPTLGPVDCPWVAGDGRGGTEIKVPGVSGEAACLAACVEKHPEANGITMSKDRTICYCELNQGSVTASGSFDNRYIYCPTTTAPTPGVILLCLPWLTVFFQELVKSGFNESSKSCYVIYT